MLNKALIVALGLSSFAALAETQKPVAEDLSLPGARWLGKSTGFLCGANQEKVAAPAALEAIQVVFETVTTDYTLDNGLLKASFVDGDSTCSYSALILADNTKKTLELSESRAFAKEGEGTCEAGKATLDSLLAANTYLYWGHPHHLTIMIEDANAETLCGTDATHVGVDFVLVGRL